MDLSLSDEQRMLIGSARAFVSRACPTSVARELEDIPEGFSTDHWHAISSLDWPGMHVPEEHGGGGQGTFELALVCEELGRGPLPSPLVATTTAAALLMACNESRWLEEIAAGSSIGTFAVVEPGQRDEWSSPATEMKRRGKAAVVEGSKTIVSYAGSAQLIVVTAIDEGGELALVAVEGSSAGVGCRRLDALGGEPLYEVTLSETTGELLATGDGARAAVDRALDHAAVLGAAYHVGIAERALGLAVEHARSREQFGRPIGSFQGVAHRCAEMRADIDAMRALVQQAAWRLDTGGPADLEVGAAKAYANEALRNVIRNAHQVLGAIGFSMEHDLQLFSRRAKAFELTLGSATHHRERVARAMGL